MGRNIKATEVSKMRAAGGFRQDNRARATRLVNETVASVLGAEATPHLALIASAIAQPATPAAQKVLRRFGLTAEKLAELRATLAQGYQLDLAERGRVDATFS